QRRRRERPQSFPSANAPTHLPCSPRLKKANLAGREIVDAADHVDLLGSVGLRNNGVILFETTDIEFHVLLGGGCDEVARMPGVSGNHGWLDRLDKFREVTRQLHAL